MRTLKIQDKTVDMYVRTLKMQDTTVDMYMSTLKMQRLPASKQEVEFLIKNDYCHGFWNQHTLDFGIDIHFGINILISALDFGINILLILESTYLILVAGRLNS